MSGKCGIRNSGSGIAVRGGAAARSAAGAMQHVKFEAIAINSVAKKKPTAEDAAHYIGLEHIDPGCFVVSRWGGDVAPIGDKLLMKKGDVLFGRRRAYQRKVAIAPFDGIFSAHGMVLRPKTDVVDEKFFPFFIASDQFMNEAIRISVGGLSPTINWGTLKNCEFDLPPMDEQKKLAELLWAANDLKESYKKAITATDEMLKAKFREMFGDAGDDASRGGAETRSVELRECITDILGGKTPSMSNSEFYGGDVPFIKSGDVREDYISEGSVWLSDKALSKGGAKYVPKGAVIIVVRSATLKNELRVAVAKQDVVINQDLKAFVPSQDYLPTFLMLAIRMQAEVLLSCVKTMLTSHIEVEEICKLPIPALSLSLQREFVAIADKAELAKANLKKSIAAIDQVMKGLINHG